MEVEFIRVRKAKIPELRLSRAFWQDAGDAIAGGIVDNVLKQKTTDGGRLKTNAPSTRERKRRKNRPQLSLIDKLHRFIKRGGGSWEVQVGDQEVSVGAATGELADLVRWLGERGYRGYIGISKSVRKAIRAALRKEIKRLLHAVSDHHDLGLTESQVRALGLGLQQMLAPLLEEVP